MAIFVILASDYPKGDGVKICDATLDGYSAEIKAVEGGGRWAICSKLVQAIKQGADWVILRFPDKAGFSRERIEEGLSLYLNECEKKGHKPKSICISALVEITEVTITKPPRYEVVFGINKYQADAFTGKMGLLCP